MNEFRIQTSITGMVDFFKKNSYIESGIMVPATSVCTTICVLSIVLFVCEKSQPEKQNGRKRQHLVVIHVTAVSDEVTNTTVWKGDIHENTPFCITAKAKGYSGKTGYDFIFEMDKNPENNQPDSKIKKFQ